MASPQEEKAHLVKALLLAKESSGKTFSQIAEEIGVTNVFLAQLFHRQAPLPDSLAKPLLNAVPQLGTNNLLESMKPIPMRSCDPSTLQDPTIYRELRITQRNCRSQRKTVSPLFDTTVIYNVTKNETMKIG
ncbi:hypothetical protein KP509_1Z143300 [Ceratopteris richardii]|nr:hypothetical protein KP509_1Z143300 [Ceratopteris richardii]